VERDSWDEQRLRALCARHGWDFEWMTEARRLISFADAQTLQTKTNLGEKRQ
ncbi:Hypothetical protein (Fragment), partial [Durusdinium trenchii]